jgi:hypothetical protein
MNYRKRTTKNKIDEILAAAQLCGATTQTGHVTGVLA